eukprot:363221-Chlamydomonas_euryale.AAC.29
MGRRRRGAGRICGAGAVFPAPPSRHLWAETTEGGAEIRGRLVLQAGQFSYLRHAGRRRAARSDQRPARTKCRTNGAITAVATDNICDSSGLHPRGSCRGGEGAVAEGRRADCGPAKNIGQSLGQPHSSGSASTSKSNTPRTGP